MKPARPAKSPSRTWTTRTVPSPSLASSIVAASTFLSCSDPSTAVRIRSSIATPLTCAFPPPSPEPTVDVSAEGPYLTSARGPVADVITASSHCSGRGQGSCPATVHEVEVGVAHAVLSVCGYGDRAGAVLDCGPGGT